MKPKQIRVGSNVMEAMQVPPKPTTPQDFLAWGYFGSWMGARGDWRLTAGVGHGVEVTIDGKKQIVEPSSWVVRDKSGVVSVQSAEAFTEMVK